jgi:hypothetical protein
MACYGDSFTFLSKYDAEEREGEVGSSERHYNGWERKEFIRGFGKPEGKRPQGRPRRRRMDNIKMDLLEIGLNVVDWIGLAQGRYRWRALVKSVMNLRVP